MTFEAYWNEVRKCDEVKNSEDLLHKLAVHLDVGTTKHSKRTAMGVAMVTYAASIEHDIAVPLIAGAQVHDLGKHACQDIILASFVDYTQPFNAYMQRRHPHDGFELVKRQLPRTAYSDLAAAHVLTHHTHKNAEESNYPTPAILKLYTDIGDVTKRQINVTRISGPILAHNDLMDAMTHPQERPYMADDERLKAMSYAELVDNAVFVAERDLKTMPFGITPHQIGTLLLAYHPLADAYSAQ